VHLERLEHRLVLAVTSGILGLPPLSTPGHPVIDQRRVSLGPFGADARCLGRR
jgi:hypothetical protein